jgi:exopolysaccharide biosynthesis protein
LIYTSTWGTKSPNSKATTEHILVKNNIIEAKSDKPLNIPKNGFVVTMPKDKANLLKIGNKIELNYNINPNWENIDHVISGGPYLLKNGEKYIDAESQKLNGVLGRNPRTAVGYTKDNVLIMVTVDGRKEGTSGVTLNELANIMKELGCYEAINLDGGSSTVMFVDGTILSGSNIKNTSISNVLAVKIKA